MNLTQKSIDRIVAAFQKSFPKREEMIGNSFLSEEVKAAYWQLVSRRWEVLGI